LTPSLWEHTLHFRTTPPVLLREMLYIIRAYVETSIADCARQLSPVTNVLNLTEVRSKNIHIFGARSLLTMCNIEQNPGSLTFLRRYNL
jgi:hypothetical protein